MWKIGLRNFVHFHKTENYKMSIKEIEEKLKPLHKIFGSGADDISCWVLKECAQKSRGPLYTIMKELLNQGKLPENGKWQI